MKKGNLIIAYLYTFTREETFSIMMIQHNSAQSTSGLAVSPERGFALSNIHNFWAEQTEARTVQCSHIASY